MKRLALVIVLLVLGGCAASDPQFDVGWRSAGYQYQAWQNHLDCCCEER